MIGIKLVYVNTTIQPVKTLSILEDALTCSEMHYVRRPIIELHKEQHEGHHITLQIYGEAVETQV